MEWPWRGCDLPPTHPRGTRPAQCGTFDGSSTPFTLNLGRNYISVVILRTETRSRIFNGKNITCEINISVGWCGIDAKKVRTIGIIKAWTNINKHFPIRNQAFRLSLYVYTCLETYRQERYYIMKNGRQVEWGVCSGGTENRFTNRGAWASSN